MKRYAVVEVGPAGRIYFENDWEDALKLWRECFEGNMPAPMLLELDDRTPNLENYGAVKDEERSLLLEELTEELI